MSPSFCGDMVYYRVTDNLVANAVIGNMMIAYFFLEFESVY